LSEGISEGYFDGEVSACKYDDRCERQESSLSFGEILSVRVLRAELFTAHSLVENSPRINRSEQTKKQLSMTFTPFTQLQKLTFVFPFFLF